MVFHFIKSWAVPILHVHVSKLTSIQMSHFFLTMCEMDLENSGESRWTAVSVAVFHSQVLSELHSPKKNSERVMLRQGPRPNYCLQVKKAGKC